MRVDDADPLAGRDTLGGLNDSVGPAGENAEVSDTVPLKLLRLVNETVDDPHCPCWMDRVPGKRLIAKSGVGGGGGMVIVKGISIECEMLLLVPVIVSM